MKLERLLREVMGGRRGGGYGGGHGGGGGHGYSGGRGHAGGPSYGSHGSGHSGGIGEQIGRMIDRQLLRRRGRGHSARGGNDLAGLLRRFGGRRY